MFTVILRGGSVSDPSTISVLVGEVDPQPILDNYVKVVSNNAWKTVTEMDDDKEIRTLDHKRYNEEKAKFSREVRREFFDLLLSHGFKPATKIEVWIGE